LTDEYSFYTQKIYETNETLMEPLKKSMKNSIIKYNKTRDPASAASVQLMKTNTLRIHPCLMDMVDTKEQDLMDFKSQLG